VPARVFARIGPGSCCAELIEQSVGPRRSVFGPTRDLGIDLRTTLLPIASALHNLRDERRLLITLHPGPGVRLTYMQTDPPLKGSERTCRGRSKHQIPIAGRWATAVGLITSD